MAWDEALLENVARLGQTVLRFYSWQGTPASFGFSQKYAEVERLTALRPLIRRPTGGGVVPHAADWTYSLIFPPTSAWYSLRAEESYRRLHEWIRDAWRRLGVSTCLASAARKETPGCCFSGPERFDLLLEGRKIAGAAQRRNRKGLLIQGSIQGQPSGVERSLWQQAFCDVANGAWGVRWMPFEPDVLLNDQAAGLERTKYSRPEYNAKR
jgi:lipoate-protein ligase A